MQHYRSVVKIYTTALQPSYREAWRSAGILQHSGSGFILNYKNKLYLITNAHTVNNSTFIQVKLADAEFPTKYEAQLVTLGIDCDLAILEVKDPEFLKTIEPLTLATQRNETGDKVKVFGFPAGGEECCQTEGIVSRSDWGTYAFSKHALLTTSIDAKISPGSSGGPVINQDNQVIGVVHQGSPDGKILGQIVPLNIIMHFLEDSTKNPRYIGFPFFNVVLQAMDNHNLRAFYGMQDKQSGILVITIPDFSIAQCLLQEHDVLLEINGIPISNLGKINIKPDFDTPVDFRVLIQQAYIGDKINFKVMRNKQEIQIDILLTKPLGSDRLIPLQLNEAIPAYIEHSGMILQPLTRNYMNTFYNKETESSNSPPALEQYTYQSNSTEFTQKNRRSIIFIRAILQHAETQGYNVFNNTIIAKINGREISTLWSAWHALNDNQGDTHIIETENNHIFVLKNLPPEANEQLRKTYQIPAQTSPQFIDTKRWSLFMQNFKQQQKVQRFAKAKMDLHEVDEQQEQNNLNNISLL